MAMQERNLRSVFVFCLISILALALYSAEPIPQTFPDMGLAAYLQTYGGWALSALLIIAIHRLYTQTSKLLEERNKEFNDVLRETTRALEANARVTAENKAVLERLERLLNNVNIAMRTCQQRNGIVIPENGNGPH